MNNTNAHSNQFNYSALKDLGKFLTCIDIGYSHLMHGPNFPREFSAMSLILSNTYCKLFALS